MNVSLPLSDTRSPVDMVHTIHGDTLMLLLLPGPGGGIYRETDIDRSNAWGGGVREGWSIGKPLIADDRKTVFVIHPTPVTMQWCAGFWDCILESGTAPALQLVLARTVVYVLATHRAVCSLPTVRIRLLPALRLASAARDRHALHL